jgi:signal transduction histidine kinase
VLLIVRNAAESELQSRLDQQLTSITAAFTDDESPTAGEVDAIINDGDAVQIVMADGDVRVERNMGDVASPVEATTTGPGGATIRLVTSGAELNERFREQVVRLGIVAVVAIIASALLATVQARQLATPLERLARSASRLGDGDFSVTGPPPSGIREIDDISRALRLSANRVERMLNSERGFTADATHQLRTGLTGIAMRLEVLERSDDPGVAAEAGAALTQTHDLNVALDELLRVARKGSTGERTEIDLVDVVDHHVSDWQQRFAGKRRQVVVTTGRVQTVMGTPGLVGQVLDILLDNALRHGRGTVAILVQDDSVTIEDEGPGLDDDRVATLFVRPDDHRAPHGRGLPLARRLAEADGGRLELIEQLPPTFRLTLVPVPSKQ